MRATATIAVGLLDLFDEPALGHISYTNDQGHIVTFPMWVDYDGENLLVSSPVGSRKGAAMRGRPQVAVSIASSKNQFHWLSASGRVVELRPDVDLAFIDRMSRKYLGVDYQRRTPREVFVIEIERISDSGGWD